MGDQGALLFATLEEVGQAVSLQTAGLEHCQPTNTLWVFCDEVGDVNFVISKVQAERGGTKL